MKVDVTIEITDADKSKHTMNLLIADELIKKFIIYDEPLTNMVNKVGLNNLEEVAEHIMAFVKNAKSNMRI